MMETLDFDEFYDQHHLLHIPYRALTDAHVPRLLAYLDSHREIKVLNISNNYFSEASLQLISQIKSINYLIANNCCLLDTGAEILSKNENLVTLSVAGNCITPPGAKALAASTTLRYLYLTNNYIGNDGAAFFAKNKSLIFLDVSGNLIEEKGIALLLCNFDINEIYYGAYNDPSITLWTEKDPFIRINNAKKLKVMPELPSLRLLSFFAIQKSEELKQQLKDCFQVTDKKQESQESEVGCGISSASS